MTSVRSASCSMLRAMHTLGARGMTRRARAIRRGTPARRSSPRRRRPARPAWPARRPASPTWPRSSASARRWSSTTSAPRTTSSPRPSRTPSSATSAASTRQRAGRRPAVERGCAGSLRLVRPDRPRDGVAHLDRRLGAGPARAGTSARCLRRLDQRWHDVAAGACRRRRRRGHRSPAPTRRRRVRPRLRAARRARRSPTAGAPDRDPRPSCATGWRGQVARRAGHRRRHCLARLAASHTSQCAG